MEELFTPVQLFPAHAGMNRAPFGQFAAPFTVPRTRGDEPSARLAYVAAQDCSPHTRG